MYPKALFLSGWDDPSQSIVVESEEAEAIARANGYRGIDEPAPAKRGRPAAQEAQ